MLSAVVMRIKQIGEGRLVGFMVQSQKIFLLDSKCMLVDGVQFIACPSSLLSRDPRLLTFQTA